MKAILSLFVLVAILASTTAFAQRRDGYAGTEQEANSSTGIVVGDTIGESDESAPCPPAPAPEYQPAPQVHPEVHKYYTTKQYYIVRREQPGHGNLTNLHV